MTAPLDAFCLQIHHNYKASVFYSCLDVPYELNSLLLLLTSRFLDYHSCQSPITWLSDLNFYAEITFNKLLIGKDIGVSCVIVVSSL